MSLHSFILTLLLELLSHKKKRSRLLREVKRVSSHVSFDAIRRAWSKFWGVGCRPLCPPQNQKFRIKEWWIIWRRALIHRGGRDGASGDLRRALPFIRRQRAQKRTVRELGVGSDHTRKQSKPTRSSCSTCHSTSTNRSIWGGGESFAVSDSSPCARIIFHTCEKSILNTYQSLWQGKCWFEEPTWGKCAASAECPLSKLAIWISAAVLREDKRPQKSLTLQSVSF